MLNAEFNRKGKQILHLILEPFSTIFGAINSGGGATGTASGKTALGSDCDLWPAIFIRLSAALAVCCVALTSFSVPICQTLETTAALAPVEEPPIPFRDVYKPGITAAKEQLLRTANTSTCEAASIHAELAAYEYADEQFQLARAYLKKARQCVLADTVRCAILDKHDGDCALAMEKFDEALARYDACLPILTGSEHEALIEPVLESMSLCLVRLGRSCEALEKLELLAFIHLIAFTSMIRSGVHKSRISSFSTW